MVGGKLLSLEELCRWDLQMYIVMLMVPLVRLPWHGHGFGAWAVLAPVGRSGIGCSAHTTCMCGTAATNIGDDTLVQEQHPFVLQMRVQIARLSLTLRELPFLCLEAQITYTMHLGI